MYGLVVSLLSRNLLSACVPEAVAVLLFVGKAYSSIMMCKCTLM